MRGLAYAIAAIAAVGIMYVFAMAPNDRATSDQSGDQTASPATIETQTAENAEVLASATNAKVSSGTVTIAVPEMHCEFACFPKVKETLESYDTVEMVELGPQKEEGAIDNRQVIVKYKPGFDVKDAIAKLAKEGFDDSDVVQ